MDIYLAAMFTGKSAQIAALLIITVALIAFAVVAMRLRKGVVNTLDEATGKMIDKFVLPSTENNSSSSTTNVGGNNTSILRTVQNGVGTVGAAAMAGNQVANLVDKMGGKAGDVGGGNNNNNGGSGAGILAGDHKTVASGSGDEYSTDMNVNQNTGGAEVNSQKSANNSSSTDAANASYNSDNGVNNTDKNVESSTDNKSAYADLLSVEDSTFLSVLFTPLSEL